MGSARVQMWGMRAILKRRQSQQWTVKLDVHQLDDSFLTGRDHSELTLCPVAQVETCLQSIPADLGSRCQWGSSAMLFFRLTLTIHNVKTHYPRVLHRRNGIPIAIYDHPSFDVGNPSSDRMSLVVVGRCRRCLSSPCAAKPLLPFPSGLPVGELRGLCHKPRRSCRLSASGMRTGGYGLTGSTSMAEVAGVASALNPHSELGVHCDLGLPPILSRR